MSEAPCAEALVEVAVPVPLRRSFTYRLPEALGPAPRGARVVVPFGRRKLAAVVLGPGQPPPAEVALKDVVSVLDGAPVFGEELLAFLEEAARYYFHPIGEVLRAAAPALPAEAGASLRAIGFLDAGESLPGRAEAAREELWVLRLGDPAASAGLGRRQAALYGLLEDPPAAPWSTLRRAAGASRATLASLEAKGLVRLESRPRLEPFAAALEAQGRDTPRELTDEQRAAADAIVGASRAGEARAFLLHGVTGSGKTEVYMHVVRDALERGLGALVLVPEIALTPQLVARFRARFGEAIAVLHSGMKDRERDAAARALREGRARLAIGARSALFAPVPSLGVLVVDEEHDGSFKQEEGFRYHARDMALLRAHRAGAVCVLGSATPSLESYHRAERGRLALLQLTRRATGATMPPVEVVDLRRNASGPSGHALVSAPLYRGLEACLGRREQAILFLNRRGYAPTMRCESCGEVAECPSCSVSLTHHQRAGCLRCHYCDYATREVARCPKCRAEPMLPVGHGTERLEEHLAEALAPAKLARLDRDTASLASVDRVLSRLRDGSVDVLVGTQMVTKGHDIPGVTLVGVILADQSLAFPDFRASERTFQLLAQVAGRAGRGEAAGRVVIQTYSPEHHAVRFAAAHDYRGFYEAELRDRRELGYAPFGHLVAFRISAVDEAAAVAATQRLAAAARQQPALREAKVSLLGPAPAPVKRVRNRFRYRLILRGADRGPLREVTAALLRVAEAHPGPALIQVDVDPVHI